jgi:hypothetical protein
MRATSSVRHLLHLCHHGLPSHAILNSASHIAATMNSASHIATTMDLPRATMDFATCHHEWDRNVEDSFTEQANVWG